MAAAAAECLAKFGGVEIIVTEAARFALKDLATLCQQLVDHFTLLSRYHAVTKGSSLSCIENALSPQDSQVAPSCKSDSSS